MILPTLRQLQYFIALAENLSFSQAADKCHITQPSLSLALREMEGILGEKLFYRKTRTVILTEVGKDLLPLARSVIEQSENMVRMAGRHRAPLTGSLSLGIIPTIAPYLLPKLLPALQSSYPSLDLRLKEDITGRQIETLKSGAIDLILMAMPFETPDMEQMILWKEPFFLARAGQNLSSSEEVKLGDLKNENILLLDDGHCLRDHVLSACQLSSTHTDQKTFGATSLQTLIQMVQNGYGATLLPLMAINPYQIPKGVVIQRFVNPQPTRQIGLCWRESDPRHQEFRILGEFIKKISYITPIPNRGS